MKKTVLTWTRKILKCILLPFAQVLGLRRLLELIAEIAEGEKSFLTYHDRPLPAASVSTLSDGLRESPSLAIVIQGPILHINGFTLETVKIYQRHFAGSRIILSTWDDESSPVIRQFEELGVMVIQNKKPLYAGESNINMQIVSTQSGMLKAKEFGVERALKTRTDQRMYAPDLADFFHNLTETFPLKGHWPKQRSRIVGCSLNSFKYRMYGLSDMLIYGDIDDMLLYWDIGLDERIFNEQQRIQAAASLGNFSRWRICEVYLATEFLKKIGREPKWSLADSWSVFADHFCVVDKEQLDLFWPKYNHREYRWLRYDEHVSTRELCFREWLNLYANLKNKKVPENVLDIPSTLEGKNP